MHSILWLGIIMLIHLSLCVYILSATLYSWLFQVKTHKKQDNVPLNCSEVGYITDTRLKMKYEIGTPILIAFNISNMKKENC